MELFNPGIGLILWSISTIISIIGAIAVLIAKFKTLNVKVAWLLAVIFVPILGTTLYFLVGRKKAIN